MCADRFTDIYTHQGFPCGSDGKESTCNAGDLGSIAGLGRSPVEEHGNPLQYSCLENPMDRGAWWLWFMGSQRSFWSLCSSTVYWSMLTSIPFTLKYICLWTIYVLVCIGFSHLLISIFSPLFPIGKHVCFLFLFWNIVHLVEFSIPPLRDITWCLSMSYLVWSYMGPFVLPGWTLLHSSSWLSRSAFSLCTTFCLRSHLSMDIFIASVTWLF